MPPGGDQLPIAGPEGGRKVKGKGQGSPRGGVKNILIVGVGGQGVLLASEVLGDVAARSGLDVKKSEVHGMAQRGGSVVSHLRFGRRIYSPLIPRGEADFLLSFEKLETLRYLDYLRPDGRIVASGQQINPLPVSSGRMEYPGGVEKTLRERGVSFRIVDGLGLAERAGNRKAVNSVMLGILSSLLPFPRALWLESLRGFLPERLQEVNIKAFGLGRSRRSGAGRPG